MTDPKSIALAYIDACARQDQQALDRLLAPDLRFQGPGGVIEGAQEYSTALKRIASVWVKSEVKKVFGEGEEVAVIYHFVTDTPAGSVPCLEWLRIEGGRVASVWLLFDRVSFKPALDEALRRAR